MNNNTESFDLEDELFEHFKFEVPKGQAFLRIDKYLMGLIPNATRNKIQNAANDGNIFVNDEIVKSNYKVKPLDVIKVMLSHPPFENHVLPENIPLNIVYEDEALLLVNKEPGLVVHPGHGNYTGTLVNALAFHFDNLPMNSSERPGLVHRIDKDTSGLLVIAKTEAAMTHLAKQFEAKTTEREYMYSLSVVLASNCLAKCVIAASVFAITNKPEVSLSIRCTNPGRSLLFIGKLSK
jgi:23S rRNA pseudouridine1911/1915/1917 synthase